MEFAKFVPYVTNVWSAISIMLFVHQMAVCVENLNIRVSRIKLWENHASCSSEWDGFDRSHPVVLYQYNSILVSL